MMILDSLIPFLSSLFDLNMSEMYNFSNFTSHGIFKVAFEPYLAHLDNYFWGAFFGIIGVAIYANERSIGTIAVYMILVGIFMAIVFPVPLAGIFGLILAFILAVIFYKAFIEDTI
jgi:hypothetical protein